VSALAAVLFQVTACTGLGALGWRLLRGPGDMALAEHLTWSFILGFGLLGWLLFFVGWADLFQAPALITLLGAGCLALVTLRGNAAPKGDSPMPFRALDWTLLAVLAAALAMEIPEGLSPVADGDSLAYHFELAKVFLRDGHITFVPRAVDGAVPMLVQMTYVPPLALGGEMALTLWAMFSSWAVALAQYFLARRYLARHWALTVVLMWVTTPAVLYGGGSGQVEVRIAGFVLLTALCLIRLRETGLTRFAAAAGIAAGLFVGAKYTGLFFGAAGIVAVACEPHRLRSILIYGVFAALAGFQWYFWNLLHTGDPVFPMLYGLLGYETPYWNEGHHLQFQHNFFNNEHAVASNPIWMLLYPFLATFATSPLFDSERAGLGPFFLLTLPFAALAFWQGRGRILRHPLWPAFCTVVVFYTLWFLVGSSQRTRHLVPIYPVVLVLVVFAVSRWVAPKRVVAPFVAAVLFALGIQGAGHGVSALNYLRHVVTDETRDAFLTRNVAGYRAVQWINTHLSAADKVLIYNRNLHYLVRVPTYFAHATTEVLVDLRPEAYDPLVYDRQLRALGVTHVLSPPYGGPSGPPAALQMWQSMVGWGCAHVVADFEYRAITSRTFESGGDQSGGGVERQSLVRLGGQPCHLAPSS
jgi:hypothetical protein